LAPVAERQLNQLSQMQDNYDFVIALLDTGMRYDEMAKLTWSVHSKRGGELRQPYPEGQEDQTGALGLVVSIIVEYDLYERRVRAIAARGISDRSG
jgi:hypothetical protein